jgi:hypothetical protein
VTTDRAIVSRWDRCYKPDPQTELIFRGVHPNDKEIDRDRHADRDVRHRQCGLRTSHERESGPPIHRRQKRALLHEAPSKAQARPQAWV